MIHVRGLSVVLGNRSIVQNLDFDVDEGTAVALVGPNGAGKTTVLRSVVGLVRYEGRIAIDGIDLAHDPVGAKRLIGYMPQVAAFCEETARASLVFLARLRRVPMAEVDSRLERVGLAEHARRRVRTFSTGMRQRLSLAAALLGDPPLLLLDEPTASLDVRGQAEFLDLLHTLQKEGRTLLLSSHRTEEIRALAERIIVLNEGRTASPELTEEVLTSIWGKPQNVTPVTRGKERRL
jgi:ABC-type multidrug transport system ATPase subunit